MAAGIIALAVVANSFVLVDNWAMYGPYYLLFLICAALDVCSHALKESLIRSIPLEQEKFNYNISISQLIVGLALSPIILAISRKYESYGTNILASDSTYYEFLGNYAKYGFGCVLNFKSEEVYKQDGYDVC